MENKGYQQPVNTEQTFKEYLEYIKNDIIAQQVNGLYCKVSRILNCITVVNLSKEKHINYWVRSYGKDKEHPERIEMIRKACEEKFETGLTPLEEVIEIQKKSKDSKAETKKMIEEITKEKTEETFLIDLDEEDEDEEDDE